MRPTNCDLTSDTYKIEGFVTKIGQKVAKIRDI